MPKRIKTSKNKSKRKQAKAPKGVNTTQSAESATLTGSEIDDNMS